MICPKCKEDGYVFCELRQRNECLFCGYNEEEKPSGPPKKPIEQSMDKNPKGE